MVARSVAATEVRELAEPCAPQPGAASTPLDDPAGSLRLRGTIGRADVADACVRAADVVARRPTGPVACDLGGLEDPALPVVDVLAHLALVCRRSRHELRLEHASPAILELLALCGLMDLWADPGRSGRQVGR